MASGLNESPCRAEDDDVKFTFRGGPRGSGAAAAGAGAGAAGAAAGAAGAGVRAAASPPVTVIAGGVSYSVQDAAARGLITLLFADDGEYRVLVPRGSAVQLRVAGSDIGVQVNYRVDGVTSGAPQTWVSAKGPLAVVPGAATSVTRNGKAVKPRKTVDRKAPKTTASVRVRGRYATVQFRSRDASGVRSIVAGVKGRKGTTTLRRGQTWRVRLNAGRTTIRWQATDIFGNVEQLRSRKVR